MQLRRPTKGLILFGIFTFVVSAAVQVRIVTAGATVEQQPMLVMLLMWTPGLACIATRLLLREGFSDVSFRIGGRAGWKSIALGWLYPVPIGLVAYGLGWGLKLASFSSAPVKDLGLDLGSDYLHFLARLGVSVFLLTPISLISAFGEELGWRGYLLPRLVEAEVARPLLFSGVCWGLWHVPLILTGQYVHGPNPWLAALVFLVFITADAFLLGWMRLRTGSVWPAAIGHASWNAIIQGTFDRSTSSPSIWVGEGGIFTMSITVLFTLMVLNVARRRPQLEPMERFA
jgi:uncharacterized protein